MRLLKISNKVILWSIVSFIGCQAFAQTGMKVGATKEDITPAVDALPSNYTSIRDRLFTRVIVIENNGQRAALITADVAAFPDVVWDKVTKRILKETGIPVSHVLLCASHSHSVPFLAGEMMVAANDTGAEIYTNNLENSILKAVHQAIEKLQPALAGYGTGLSYLNVNRDVIDPETRLWSQGPNYEGSSDKTVAVVKFENLNGEPIAVFVNYAMHANTLFMCGVLSSDMPGETSRYIENTYDDKVVALWTSGAAGDQNPLYFMSSVRFSQPNQTQGSNSTPGITPQASSRTNPRTVARQEQLVTSMGQFLGEEVLRVMKYTKRTETNLNIRAFQDTITCPGRTRTNTGREGAAGTYVDGDPVNIRLGLLMIGDIALATVNGELYNSIAQRIKKESPFGNTIVVCITNGMANSGYIPSDEAFVRYTFQVLGSKLKPGCAENSIVNGLLDMMDNVK